jgi:hypothetical protein
MRVKSLERQGWAAGLLMVLPYTLFFFSIFAVSHFVRLAHQLL